MKVLVVHAKRSTRLAYLRRPGYLLLAVIAQEILFIQHYSNKLADPQKNSFESKVLCSSNS